MAVFLTTTDNPYDPISQYDDWFAWDEQKGYHTNGYLARIALTSPNLNAEENDEAIERAIDEIVETAPLIYKKIKYTAPEGG